MSYGKLPSERAHTRVTRRSSMPRRPAIHTTTDYVRRCDRCCAELSPTEIRKCGDCKATDERRVFISNALDRPWHIQLSYTPWNSDSSESAYHITACGHRLYAYAALPGWPKSVTGLSELARQFPAALVCRQCSDHAPIR